VDLADVVALFGGELLVQDMADVIDHIGLFGKGLGAGRTVGHEAGRRRVLFIIDHFIEGGILPAFAAQVRQRNTDGDLLHPGGEHAAPLEAVELIKDAQKRFLCHFLDERREQWIIGRKPA